MKKIGNVFSTLLTIEIVLILFLALFTTVPKLLGYNEYEILTGSMEPTISVGSLVFVDNSDPSSIEEGDVIAFYAPNGGNVVTHRVVNKNDINRQFNTKGDANESEDFTPIKYENVIGKVIISFPKLGIALNYIFSLYGKIAMGVIALILLLGSRIGNTK